MNYDDYLNHDPGDITFIHTDFWKYDICRVTIATWNVAGRVPDESLEIDDWLCTEDPGDIYIIG